MGKIAFEIAKQEVDKWLSEIDYTIDPEDQSEVSSLKTITNAICDGVLILNDDCSFTQNLKQPIGKEIIINSFKYKTRLTTGEIQEGVSGTKGSDVDGRFIGFISKLTSQPKAIVKAMDSRDYKIGMSIAVFFM